MPKPEKRTRKSPASSPADAHSADRADHPEAVIAPLLPLIGNVVYPQSIYPLSLRGEQSARLVDEAIERGGLVALFLQRDLATDAPGIDDLYKVGTLARLQDVSRSREGDIDFTVVGLQRVRLSEVVHWEPFLLARLDLLPESGREEPGAEPLLAQVRGLYRGLLSANPRAEEAMQDALEQSRTPHELAYLLGSTLPVSPAAKQALLEVDSGVEKLLQLVPLLTKAHEVNAAGFSGHGEPAARGTTSGIPAQLANLDQADSKDPLLLDRIELRTRLQQCTLPPEVRRTAERELDRLAGLTPASPDYGTVRSYLQCLADLPWDDEDEPEFDLQRARGILERDHYGLSDVKERIVEYLAVRKLRHLRRDEPENQGALPTPGDPVLCLVGPPGIGKTSLGQSVAEALGRPFIRISLGGVSDEAEIRGHRRTYVGAMPGKIIQALARASTSHPVVMLDELDKVGSGGKGDPASALLEVLDPEQQRTFLDHYLDTPYDLSQVFFIATANVLDNLAPALRDRLEVIQLSGYTEEEKVQIALRHIIPRQLEWHALTERDIQWTEDAALSIARNYTREAGVRQLEREIATICRRVATLVAEEEGVRPYVVDSDFVVTVLGTPRYLPEQAEVTDQPGVVTGVVWTPVGGDIIHVEASIMPGREKLTITGQIGEVMRESAQAALSFVRSEAGSLGIGPDFFEHQDIHLHVPSGAVPKDGPSAGITMAVALVSLLTGKPVPPDIAMTGEITLRGRVLPVGGIKEKILAARRAGINLMVLSSQNRRDVDAIAPDLLDGIDFAFVDTMQGVLEAALSVHSRQKTARGRKDAGRPHTEAGDGGEHEMPRAAKRR